MQIETSPGNEPIANSPFDSVQGAADAAQTAQEGARLLAEFWIEQGVCLTSGHTVHALREARGKSLMVNQRPVGAETRALFETGALPSYDDGLGNPIRPVRKMIYTTRTDTRTPVGTGVYVIGPSEEEIDAFEAEINIAEAPMVDDGQGGQVSAAAALLGATPNLNPGAPQASPLPAVTPSGKVAVANGKMVPGIPVAVVHADGRLCIPRVAFEALAFETGEPIKGGDTLYLSETPDCNVFISRDASTQGDEVHPTTDRLRLHLTIPGVNVGDEFRVLVSKDGLTVKLN